MCEFYDVGVCASLCVFVWMCVYICTCVFVFVRVYCVIKKKKPLALDLRLSWCGFWLLQLVPVCIPRMYIHMYIHVRVYWCIRMSICYKYASIYMYINLHTFIQISISANLLWKYMFWLLQLVPVCISFIHM